MLSKKLMDVIQLELKHFFFQSTQVGISVKLQLILKRLKNKEVRLNWFNKVTVHSELR